MRRCRLLGLAVLLVALVGVPTAPAGARVATIRVTHDTALEQLFGAYGDAGTGDRWTGGDSAYSQRLADGRTLWIFSDTFLGTVNPDHTRNGFTQLVHNS